MDRRNFLKTCMACGTAAMLSPLRAWGIGSFEGYPDGMGVLVDLTRCVGCRSCEAACNKEQGLPEPDVPFDDASVFEQKRRPDEKAYTVVNRYAVNGGKGPCYRKVQCNHCNEPACLTSCFVNAYTKTREGAVVYNPKVCVGCRTCMVACPFNVPAFSYSSATNPVIRKCIFCYDTRVRFGRPPACVESCPQEALSFGHRNELVKMGHERIRANTGRYVDHIYGEKELGGTSWLYLSAVPFDQVGFDTTLGNEPIISSVKDFLGIVPMVLVIWPVLFTGFHQLANNRRNRSDRDDERQQEEDSVP